jgi:membrane-associated phospholipid phosphatase
MIIGLAIFVLGTPNGKQNLYQIAISVFLTALLVTAVKFGVRRRRPQGTKSAQWSSLPKYDVYSFPSGHAARAACIAAGVFAAYPPVRVPVAIWAIGVCWARVAVAAHYLFDVLIGILIGVLATTLVARLWPQLIPYIQIHL